MSQSVIWNRVLEQEGLRTTGSRIASVKLSGGDIFKTSELAFLLILKVKARNISEEYKYSQRIFDSSECGMTLKKGGGR